MGVYPQCSGQNNRLSPVRWLYGSCEWAVGTLDLLGRRLLQGWGQLACPGPVISSAAQPTSPAHLSPSQRFALMKKRECARPSSKGALSTDGFIYFFKGN